LLVGKFSFKKYKIRNRKFQLFWEKLETKLRFSAAIFSPSVENLQLPVEKLQLLATPTFFNPRRDELMPRN